MASCVKIEEAIAFFEEAILLVQEFESDGSDNATYLTNLGFAYLKLGDGQKAGDACNEAVQMTVSMNASKSDRRLRMRARKCINLAQTMRRTGKLDPKYA